jgi:hypothetical protein
LYVKISNAGANWNTYAESLGGNVDIRIKKVEYYTSWPPKELPAANYTATSITVNVSNCDMWQVAYGNACTGVNTSRYIINISPTTGRWPSGYYNVLLDVNGTETGYGWFSALAFYIDTQPVNVNGSYTYTSRGRGSVYTNVTTTKNQRYYSSWYSSTDYVNTTFANLTLRRWDCSVGYCNQVDLKYPNDINVSFVNQTNMNVNGTARMNITYLANNGTWPSGYYSGELSLMSNGSETGTGWVWFSVEPFRVDISTNDYTILPSDNYTGRINIYEPGWNWPYTVLVGNYTIAQIIENKWTNGYQQIINITNYTPSINTSFNGNNTNITVQPVNGSWSSGWKSISVTVANNQSETKEGWLWFRVVPFSINVQRVSSYTIGPNSNLTVQASLTHPRTGANMTGNLSNIYKWSWPAKTYYNFAVGNCSSVTTSSCTVNGTQNIVISPPAGGWDEGYNYLYFTFTQVSDPTPIDDWSSVYFEAKPTINGWMYTVDSNGNYVWGATNTSNVTMFVYAYDANWNSININVTNVQYYYSSTGYWLEERYRTYTNASWSVINITTGQPKDSNTITSSGYIKLVSPGGMWERGDYYVKISAVRANDATDTGSIKNGYFKIKDMTPPVVTIVSPAAGQVINDSYVFLNATTSKRSTCSMIIINHENYYNWYCGSNTTGLCNRTAYNGSTYYYAYISQWWSWVNGQSSNSPSITTGGTAHAYNLSLSNAPNQDYVVKFDCNDFDWNYANNATLFRLNSTGSNQSNLTINITSVTIRPTSPTAGNTLRCNVTAVGNTTILVYAILYKNGVNITTGYQQILNNTSTEIVSAGPGYTDAGSVWVCSARAYNGVNYTNWTNSSSVTISGNSSQIVNITSVSISPSSPSTNSTLRCNATAVSFNSSLTNLTVSVKWYVNGSEVTNFVFNNVTNVTNGTNTEVSSINSGNLTAGQNWTCGVRAFNSINYSNWTNSSSVTISSIPGPAWTTNSTNTTSAGNSTLFSVYWYAASNYTNLSGFIFSINNTGTWVNDSWVAMTGTGNWSNVTKTLNSTVGLLVSWKVYANNSNNVWNSTDTFALTTT